MDKKIFILRLCLVSFVFYCILNMTCRKIDNSNRKETIQPNLRLEVLLRSDRIEAKIFNISSNDIKLWQLENSWGWCSFEVLVKGESDKKAYVIKRKNRDWTRNGPSYYTISAGNNKEIILNLKDGWWEIPKGVEKLTNNQISVQVKLDIDPTAEASEYSVFTGGTVSSDWIISFPPHRWLF